MKFHIFAQMNCLSATTVWFRFYLKQNMQNRTPHATAHICISSQSQFSVLFCFCLCFCFLFFLSQWFSNWTNLMLPKKYFICVCTDMCHLVMFGCVAQAWVTNFLLHPRQVESSTPSTIGVQVLKRKLTKHLHVLVVEALFRKPGAY